MQNSKAERPNIAPGYGISKKPNGLMAWDWVDAQMEKSRNYWICTTCPDGKPHVAPVWGIWLDGGLYFGGDPQARRSRNIAVNPAASVHLESGDDVVIMEGIVEEVRDKALLKRIAEAYAAKYMPLDLEGESAMMYGFKPRKALAWLEKDYPNTATRWRIGTA